MSDKQPTHTMTYSDVVALNQVMGPIGELMDKPIMANGDDYYIDGQIRLWNTHGWSPGYIDLGQDWPMFVADYQERE